MLRHEFGVLAQAIARAFDLHDDGVVQQLDAALARQAVGDGQVLGQGTPAELMSSTNPRIQQFMKGIPDGPVPFHYPAPGYLDDLLGAR